MHASHQRIYAAIAAIPRGRVASYGAIAARAGLPGRARLVGKLLGQTPADMPLPWYRVLRAEGIEVNNGRVPLSRFGLDGDLDRKLWGMP